MTGIALSTLIVIVLSIAIAWVLIRLAIVIYKRLQELMIKEVHTVLLSNGESFMFSVNNKGKWRWEHEDAKGKRLDKTRWKFDSKEEAEQDAKEHGFT